MSKKREIKKGTDKTLVIDRSNGEDLKWKWFIVIAAVVSFGLSVFNYYALDDFIVLVKNHFVQKGFSGIWKILSMDTFAGMTDADIMVLSGGRYRPLSLVTFAIEHQLLGNHPRISHFINLATYAFTGILLYNFLKSILSFQLNSTREFVKTKAGLITILFICLPAHSEPVINIKGRDDLMCLMFFLLAAIQLLKFVQTNENKNLIYSSIFYFLSLMSKETALTFIFIFPLILYFFTNAARENKIKTTVIYSSIALLFLFFRFLATKDNNGTESTDVLNNPFIHAATGQRYATVFLTWLLYLKLFIYPVDLSYDYNYNEIPLTDFSDWRVIFSLLIHFALFLNAILLFKKKSIISFSILFYLLTFSILSNFFFNIGTIFADRFIFIPSLGFCILIVLSIFFIIEKNISVKNKKISEKIVFGFFTIIFLLFSYRNIARCPEWKDNFALFIADTKSTPQSAKIQLNAAIAYLNMSDNKDKAIRDSLINLAIIHLRKGISIYPTFPDGYLNMGVAYSRMGNNDSAEVWWNLGRKLDPENPGFASYDKILSNKYFNAGLQKGNEGKFPESISNMKIALGYDSLNADILYNLGGAYFTIHNSDSARYFFNETLKINPSDQRAIQGLQALSLIH